ncbi:hypothetical protein TcCL_ESM11823 [Trypanosoma cruzi]|nr:hypothetical protein TcCL_ESM11823 [Trypanosoma cruzi]
MTFTPKNDAWATPLNSAVKRNGAARFVLEFLDGEIPRHFPQQQLASTVTHIHNAKHRQIEDDGADPSPPSRACRAAQRCVVCRPGPRVPKERGLYHRRTRFAW